METLSEKPADAYEKKLKVYLDFLTVSLLGAIQYYWRPIRGQLINICQINFKQTPQQCLFRKISKLKGDIGSIKQIL